MSINYKDIWSDNKNYCIICEKDSCDSGINITGYFICENCMKNISLLNNDSEEYHNVMNKLKSTITKELLNNKNEI